MDFWIARARVNLGVRAYYRAWEHVGTAMAAKLQAVYECPTLESDTADEPVGFDEIFYFFERVGLLMIQSLSDPPLGGGTLEGNLRDLERAASDIQQLGDRHWPAPHECNARWSDAANAIRAFVNARRTGGDGDAAARNIVTTQSAVIRCMYPDSEPDMWDVFVEFYHLDARLRDAYVSLKELMISGRESLRSLILDTLQESERRKHDLLDLLGGDEPPEVPEWEPAPDPLPWPPPDHASRPHRPPKKPRQERG
ncbi:MAG: hypothetical protein ACRD2J_08750 [Thermoanaerobaculia bacterium]